jgi:hypothetical protein
MHSSAQIISYLFPILNLICCIAVVVRFQEGASKICASTGFGMMVLLFVAEQTLQSQRVYYWQWPVPVFTLLHVAGLALIAIGIFSLKKLSAPADYSQKGAQLIMNSTPVNPQSSIPGSRPIAQGSVLVSKAFYFSAFFGGIILGIILIAVGAVSAQGGNSSQAVSLMVVGFIPMLGGAIAYMVFLYKIWTIFPLGTARTTPGKAVGFLFIPFFNFYWQFVALYGWAQDYNRLVADQKIDAPVFPEGTAKALCILNLLGIIPFVNYIAGLISIVLLIMFISKSADAANAVHAHFMANPAA